MKKKIIICSVVVLVLSTFFYSASFAGCPEGKSEVQVTTPSGKQKVLCMPDQALPGLENAADHSEGTIIPSSCPCWNESDIAYYDSSRMLEYCAYDSGLLQCFTPGGVKVILEATKITYCENFLTDKYFKIFDEQWNACYSLVEKFLR